MLLLLLRFKKIKNEFIQRPGLSWRSFFLIFLIVVFWYGVRRNNSWMRAECCLMLIASSAVRSMKSRIPIGALHIVVMG